MSVFAFLNRYLNVILSAAKNLVVGLGVAMHQYCVYIMSSYRGTLYTGVTNDLMRRAYEHRQKMADGFTNTYNVSRLVYYEVTSDIKAAITREKQIKGWVRAKKIALIESVNPSWVDLAEGWYERSPPSPDPSSFKEGLRVTTMNGQVNQSSRR